MSPSDRIARTRSIVEFHLWRWYRMVFRRHDHDPGGCACGCPVIGCYPCGDDPKPIRSTSTERET